MEGKMWYWRLGEEKRWYIGIEVEVKRWYLGVGGRKRGGIWGWVNEIGGI